MMGQASQELAAVGVNNSAPSGANPAADADIVFPDVGDWAKYCDTIQKCRRAEVGKLGDKLTREGFFEIDQLTHDRIATEELARSVDIGIGLAALIIKYADEDAAKVQTGNFNMDPV